MQYLHKQQIDGIVDHITDIYRSHPSTKHDIDQSLIDNVFMVTMKFDGLDLRGLVNQSHNRPFQVELKTNAGWSRSLQQTGQRQASPPLHLYLDAFDRFNRYLLTQSFGPNFVRKRRFQPLSYAFIDFPGSRGRRDTGERISRATLLNLGRLHIHAVVAVRPDEGQRCIPPLRHMLNGFDDELKKFGDVRINHFDPEQGLANLIDYCSKGAQAVDDRYAWGDMHEVFPPERVVSSPRQQPSGSTATFMSADGLD
jgi:hypothetical protein